MGKVRVIAHRGASAYKLENTLSAVKLAFKMGADAVEVDVRLCADGEVVVIHDERVDRVTNGRGRVRELTVSELKRLKVGKEEKIPLLKEILDLLPYGEKKLLVELKEPGLEKKVVNLVKERNLEDYVEIASFFHPSVKKVKELCPKIKTGVIFTCLPVDPVDLAFKAKADILIPRKDYVTINLIEEAHENSLEVYTWVVDSEKEALKFKAMGVDGIATNKPDMVLKVIKGF